MNTEQQKIEAIANDIQDGIYGWTQKCGTEWQKWTYSLILLLIHLRIFF